MKTKQAKIPVCKLTSQQGDVLLRRLDKLPEGEQKLLSKGRCVLAHGESGHSHVIEDDEAELIQIGERILLKLTKAIPSEPLKHEEHGPQKYAPGIWEVGRVREFDPFLKMTRQVID